MQLVEQCLRSVSRGLTRIRGGARLVDFVRRHYAKRYAACGDSAVVLEDFDGDLKFRIDRAHYMGNLIYWRGYHSTTELQCLDQLLQPPMVFVDVGANHGEFTVFAAKRLGAGRVLAFEPLLENHRRLVENVELNHFANVRTYDFGLSDQRGEVEFFTSEDTKTHGGWHEGLGTMFRTDDRGRSLGRARVEVFDEVFRETGLTRLDGMKVDVEGAELFVLRGACRAIRRYRPFILMEINEEMYQAAGYCTRDVAGLLGGLGYQVSRIGRHGTRIPADAAELPRFCNTIWLPRGRC